MYIHMYVCAGFMYVHIYICMYIDTYIYIHTYTYKFRRIDLEGLRVWQTLGAGWKARD
jgi:hypothetical protein